MKTTDDWKARCPPMGKLPEMIRLWAFDHFGVSPDDFNSTVRSPMLVGIRETCLGVLTVLNDGRIGWVEVARQLERPTHSSLFAMNQRWLKKPEAVRVAEVEEFLAWYATRGVHHAAGE